MSLSFFAVYETIDGKYQLMGGFYAKNEKAARSRADELFGEGIGEIVRKR
jgi:hypothetical protein